MTVQNGIYGFASSANQSGGTFFLQPGGRSSANGTAEAGAQIKQRGAATAQSLYVRVSTNGSTTINPVTLRKGGVDTSLKVNIPATTTGTFSDTSDTATLADGDLISILPTNNDGGSWIVCGGSLVIQTSGQCATVLATQLSNWATSGTQYFSPGGTGQSTEANAQAIAVEAGVLSNLQVNVGANSLGSSASAATRKNGSAGAQSVSISAGSTGIFEDTTHTDSLAGADLWCLSQTLPSTAGLFAVHTVKLAGGASGDTTFASALSQSGTTTNFFGMWGSGAQTSESVVFHPIACAGTWSLLTVRVGTNGQASGTTTVTSRKNGAAGNQSVSFAGAATGTFQDTTHTDSIAPGDRIDMRVVGGATGAITGTFSSLYNALTNQTFSQTAIGSTTPTSSLTRAITRAQAAASTSTPVAALKKQIAAIRLATTTALGSLTKAVGAIRLGVSTPTASLARGVGHVLALTGSATPLGLLKTASARVLIAASSPVGLVVKGVARSLLGTTTPTSSLARMIGKLLPIGATTPTAFMSRLVAKSVIASSTPVGVIRRGIAKVLVANSTPAALLATVARRSLVLIGASRSVAFAMVRKLRSLMGPFLTGRGSGVTIKGSPD